MTLTPKGLATRQRIVEGGAALLRSEDAGEVTLDDVRAATRTSKSQLFHYFPGGKEELLLEVARYEADRVLADQQPYLGRLDSWGAWEGWRQAVIARYRAQGASCPLSSLMRHGDVPGGAEVISALLRRWQEELRRGIVTMQQKGEVSPDVNGELTAAALIAGVQGGVAVLRSTGDTTHLAAVLGLLIAQLRDSRSYSSPSWHPRATAAADATSRSNTGRSSSSVASSQ
ncbi:MAG TPA: helix-turn-helix domain-containing protein [Gryllotalpicola sp.]